MTAITKAKGSCLRLSSMNYRWPRCEHISKESPAQMFSSISTDSHTPVLPQTAHIVSNTTHWTPLSARNLIPTLLESILSKSDMSTPLPSRQVFLSKLRTISLAKLPECYNGITTCSICFGDLADKAKKGTSERAVRLHGTHIFGALCIRKWLEEHDSCPICRTKVHTGADNDDGRIVSDLHEHVRLLTCRRPTKGPGSLQAL